MPSDRDAKSWRLEGDARFGEGDWASAGQSYERALDLQPDDADAWYRLGNVRQEQARDKDAADCFERAVALDPSLAQAWNNLGASRDSLGQQERAAQAYRRALQENAKLLPALVNLAHLCLRTGDHAAAVPLLQSATSLDAANPGPWESLGIALAKLDKVELAEQALRTAADKQKARAKPLIDAAQDAIAGGDAADMRRTLAAALEAMPENPALMHMLAAARGETSNAPPAGYVARLFDDFAEDFDRKLVEVLDYRVPSLLAQVVAPALRLARRARIVDLGCGTGQVGAALSATQAELIGIDLSPRMLERAKQRGVYGRLIEGDVTAELQRMPAASVHAVLSGDVFIYVGALEALFAAAARALAPGGLFAFSVEGAEGEGFRLTIGGRYAHSAGYLRALAACNGLIERSMERIRVRRERDAYLEGWLACFSAPA